MVKFLGLYNKSRRFYIIKELRYFRRGMRLISIYFVLSFGFFMLGQILWTTALICEGHFFNDKFVEDMIVGQSFTGSGLFGLLGSIELYKKISK